MYQSSSPVVVKDTGSQLGVPGGTKISRNGRKPKCPSCGGMEFGKEGVCLTCGKMTETVRCSECGATNLVNQRVCGQCGGLLGLSFIPPV